MSPSVSRTRATRSPPVNCTPRNEKPPSGATGTPKTPSEALLASKNSIVVRLATSTSRKTAPNARVLAVTPAEPGTAKRTSMMLLPIGVKMRSALKARKLTLLPAAGPMPSRMSLPPQGKV